MLNCEISGEGSVDLVLLHGFLENNATWDYMEPMLRSKFRVIKIELPGHGKSPFPKGMQTMEMDFIADEVKKTVDFLKLEKFHLLGHSMGGYVCLTFLRKFPSCLQSVTLFFSTFLLDSEEKKEVRRKSLRMISENFSSYVNAGISSLFNLREKSVLEERINFAKRLAISTDSGSALAAVRGMVNRPNEKDVLKKFENKILFIFGRHDRAFDLQKTIQGIPDRENIKIYTLYCSHNGQLEIPEICAEILKTELISFQ